jgi:hypothetical protein
MEVEELQPKNVGRVVSPDEINSAAVRGIGGNEYADGNKVVRFLDVIMELPSDQAVVFPAYTGQ